MSSRAVARRLASAEFASVRATREPFVSRPLALGAMPPPPSLSSVVAATPRRGFADASAVAEPSRPHQLVSVELISDTM